MNERNSNNNGHEEDASPMSLDEAMGLMAGMARSPGTGVERVRALKSVMATLQTNPVALALPPPLTEAEVIDRLVRLLRPSGRRVAKRAMKLAFTTPERPDWMTLDIKPTKRLERRKS